MSIVDSFVVIGAAVTADSVPELAAAAGTVEASGASNKTAPEGVVERAAPMLEPSFVIGSEIDEVLAMGLGCRVVAVIAVAAPAEEVPNENLDVQVTPTAAANRRNDPATLAIRTCRTNRGDMQTTYGRALIHCCLVRRRTMARQGNRSCRSTRLSTPLDDYVGQLMAPGQEQSRKFCWISKPIEL